MKTSLRIAVGTSLLALGGCTSSTGEVNSNPGPQPRSGDAKQPPEPEKDHVNVGPEGDGPPTSNADTKAPPPPDTKGGDTKEPDPSAFDPDGDGIPNFAPNPGPKEEPPKPPEPKRVNVGPQ